MKKIFSVVVVVAVLGGLAYMMTSKKADDDVYTGERSTLRLGFTNETLEALTLVAQEQGYFDEQGIDIELTTYASGKLALGGLFGGEIDISPVAEVPVVFNAFKRNDFKILAVIGAVDDQMQIIGRKDHGIAKQSDFAGKKIGTQKGSAAHIFLAQFLMHNQIPESDVEIVYYAAPDLIPALVSGEIDAFTMKPQIVSKAEEQLGDNALVFTPRNVYNKTFVFASMNSYINDNPDVLVRFLKALDKAKSFADADPNAVAQIAADKIGISLEEAMKQLETTKLSLALEQSLLLQIEDEANWASDSGLVEGEMPNYLDFIHFDSLAEVAPEAITIIH